MYSSNSLGKGTFIDFQTNVTEHYRIVECFFFPAASTTTSKQLAALVQALNDILMAYLHVHLSIFVIFAKVILTVTSLLKL